MQGVFDYLRPSESLGYQSCIYCVRQEVPGDEKHRCELWHYGNPAPLGNNELFQTQTSLFKLLNKDVDTTCKAAK